eukprot:588314-Alexandrium_andersonii.AAC.1
MAAARARARLRMPSVARRSPGGTSLPWVLPCPRLSVPCCPPGRALGALLALPSGLGGACRPGPSPGTSGRASSLTAT